jgi:hypothetical protein
MGEPRVVSWFSCGAASAVATKLTPEAVPVYCETHSEHEDNARFLTDCERWFGRSVRRLASTEYADTWDVWGRRAYLSGINGAPCTLELKVRPRLAFQRPDDVHVLGYTNDKTDIARAEALHEDYPLLTVRFPLIEQGLDKAACLALVESAGIAVPATYAMGFPNANCLPCVKATSPAYWALVRKHFPERFERMARLSRDMGVRLTRIDDIRIFIDEIPADHPVTDPIAPACDMLCHLVAEDMTHAR